MTPWRAARAGVLAAAVALGGCATLGGQDPLVAPGPRSVGGAYTVQAPIAYSQFRNRSGQAELWTVNGPALDAVYFYYGLRPGQSLVRAPENVTLPTLRAGMAAHEVQEFFADTLRRAGYARVETAALAPVRLGAVPGFGFELRYATESGLEYEGFAQGAWRGDRLAFMYFAAPRLHFFPTLAPAARQLFASVQLP